MKWSERREELTDKEFCRRYKVTKAQFAQISSDLRLLVGRSAKDPAARRSSGSGVTTDLCLSMTLRYLAGGSYLDIIDMHKVGRSTFYKAVWCTVRAINETYSLPGLPLSNPDLLQDIADGFHTLNKWTLPGCVGAIDGIGIEITKPTPWDTMYPVQFKNRKGWWSINCQAMCDSNLRFLWCSLKSPGGTNDSSAWRKCDLYKKLESTGLQEDEAACPRQRV